MKKTISALVMILFLISIVKSGFAQNTELKISKVRDSNFIVDVGSNGGVIKNGTYLVFHGDILIGTARARIVRPNVSGFKIIRLSRGVSPAIGDYLAPEQETQDDILFDELYRTEEPAGPSYSVTSAPTQTGLNHRSDKHKESWYIYWGLGGSIISYPTSKQAVLDFVKSQPGVSHISINLDLLGFYWHVSPKMILGFVINGVGDRYEAAGEWFQINQFTYGLSMMYYLGRNFGSGPFVRTDIGVSNSQVLSSSSSAEINDTGYGLLLGSGWSFDLGGTKLLLNANYAFRSIENASISTVSFSLGGLF